jgi:hypothetical protein
MSKGNGIVARLVRRELDRLAGHPGMARRDPPTGYNPLEAIRGAMFSWVLVPFNGVRVWCELRTLNATQMESCGAVTLIDVVKGGVKPSFEEMIDMRNRQEALARSVMNRPGLDDVISHLTGVDFVAARKRAELAEIKATDMSSMTKAERADVDRRIYLAELALAFVLPEDTLGFLTEWALGADVSDIKRLTRDQLLDAAILATNGHNDPHEHLSGVFTDRDKGDIDKAAWHVYVEFKNDQEADKASKMRWVHSGRRGK